MTGKADVQAPASLKDGTSDWRILDWPGLAEGGQTMCSWEFLKGAGPVSYTHLTLPTIRA